MYSTFAILFFIAIFSTGVNARPPSKIVMGTGINIMEAPYTVMIYDRSREYSKNAIICGGTIISNKHILTAAHCVEGRKARVPANSLVVVAGENYYHFGAKTYEIGQVHVHPNYNGNLEDDVIYRADIAVLELADEIRFGRTKQPIELASEEPHSNSIGTLSGWGSNASSDDENSRTLQGIDLRVFPFKDCEGATPQLPFAKDELCVHCRSGMTICEGDSGGPLIVDEKIAGVLSRGQACRGQATAINVAYYKSWIEDAQKRRNNDLWDFLKYLWGIPV